MDLNVRQSIESDNRYDVCADARFLGTVEQIGGDVFAYQTTGHIVGSRASLAAAVLMVLAEAMQVRMTRATAEMLA